MIEQLYSEQMQPWWNNKHTIANNGADSEVCLVCKKRFNGAFAKYNLKSHIKTVHLQQKHFQCQFCGHKSSRRYNMQQHINTCKMKPI